MFSASKKEIPYEIIAHREGNVVKYYSDASFIEHDLDLKVDYSLSEMVENHSR